MADSVDKAQAWDSVTKARAEERARCIAICEGWIGTFQDREIKYTSAREYAVDAIEDIIDLIRSGVPVGGVRHD